MWINVNDKLPLGYQTVLVRVDGEYAIAEYDKHFGFNADWSGLNIYADDDSGLGVSLSGDVTHWMALPAAPQDIVETKPEQHTTGTLQNGNTTS